MKGCYVLIAELSGDSEIEIGGLGRIAFKKGSYAYVGSAMNSLEKRIARHKRKEKKLRWHIDYFLPSAGIKKILYKESERKEECETARAVAGHGEAVKGFGCSDCRCESHFFRIKDLKNLKLNGFRETGKWNA